MVHAVLTPDGESLLLYVPHVGGSAPQRMRERYDCLLYAINDGSWPTWQNAFDIEGGTCDNIGAGSGISCFRLPVAVLRTLAFAALDAPVGPERDDALRLLRDWLLATTSLVGETDVGYQGEVLITDGTRMAMADGTETQYRFLPCTDPEAGIPIFVDAPSSEGNTDPQFVFCGSDLYVYWDINNTGVVETASECETDGSTHGQHPQDQLRRARWVSVGELDAVHGHSFDDVLSRNRDYTIFLAEPTAGFVAFDMRELLEGGADPLHWDSNVAPYPCSDATYGTMVADPDLSVLSDGRMVVHYFGGCNQPYAAPGLLVSYTPGAAC